MFQGRSEVISTDTGVGTIGTIRKPLKQVHKGVNGQEEKDAAKGTASFNPSMNFKQIRISPHPRLEGSDVHVKVLYALEDGLWKLQSL